MVTAFHITSSSVKSLAVFAEDIAAELNLPILKLRHSDNWPGGEYFTCIVLGITIELGQCDDKSFPDYQFTIWFTPVRLQLPSNVFLDGFTEFVAYYLVSKDYEVAREENVGRIGSTFTVYKNKNGSVTADYISQKI